MIQRILFTAFGAFALIVTGAFAGDDKPLTQDQARRFVDTLPALEALAGEFESEGKSETLAIESQPKADEPFRPYTNAVRALKENYPADHARLAGAVKPHGFSTEEWGRVGDRVMIAWMALKMEEEDPRSMAMMEGMDRSMLNMMPPEMKEQMEATFAMMETVKNAPEADKKAVATVKADLEAYMEENGRS